MTFGAGFAYRLLKFQAREELQQLRENAAYSV
jgi:hypothetical protein